MNKKNLQRMADYIRTIPDEKLDMISYRPRADRRSVECNTVACVIGHCVILDKENVLENYIGLFENIDFINWSREFTGIRSLFSDKWRWCFSANWQESDNTTEGAARRIEYLIENEGVPDNWRSQMYGEIPLEY